MKQPLDFSSPENVVQTFTTAVQFGNLDAMIETTTGDLKTELKAMPKEEISKKFEKMKGTHFTQNKKTLNMDVDSSYIIGVDGITPGNERIFFKFYVVLEENKWLIFKIE